MRKKVLALAFAALAFASCEKEQQPEEVVVTVPSFLQGEWVCYKRELMGFYTRTPNEVWRFSKTNATVTDTNGVTETITVTHGPGWVVLDGVNYTAYNWDLLNPDSIVLFLNEGQYIGEGLYLGR